MRILLTGGAGFIGSHVAGRLLERGHEVAVVDDLSTGKRGNVPDGAEFYETDVRNGCTRIFEAFAPEALCHQAAQMDVRRFVREPDFDAEVNVLGTVRLLENCTRHGVGKVVFASTGGAVYGEQEAFPATEDHPQYPVSPYGVSKLAGERYLHFYHVQYGLPYAALRYANVYGPRQDPHGEAGVVAIFCGKMAAGKPSTINGTGEQTRDYVYVDDVARANVLALEEDPPPGVQHRDQHRDQRQPPLRAAAAHLRQGPPAAKWPRQARRAASQLRGPLSRWARFRLASRGEPCRWLGRDTPLFRSTVRPEGW
jgi:UDP-glucose 4-epimerase